MITSLMLKEKFDIEVDSNGNFYYREELGAKGTKLKISDIPFVRYRFKTFNDEELAYIDKMKSIFINSIHLVEIKLNDRITEEFNRVRDRFDNVAIYVYMEINNENVGIEEFNENQLNQLNKLKAVTDTLDRFILKDKSDTLYTVAANKLKSTASKLLNIEENMIGICSSPVSFVDNNKCLSALQARELASLYAENDTFALPTSNHECMNCGGCIRYKIVNNNLELPKKSKEKNSKGSSFNAMNKPVSSTKEENKEIKKKVSKKGVVPFDVNELLNLKF